VWCCDAGYASLTGAGPTRRPAPLSLKPLGCMLRCSFGSISDAPDRIRTCDLMLRRHALYPAELRALMVAV
jgi:hypothetical protein